LECREEAAAANYPCLTVPMGYTATGQPIGITFISRPFQEDMLLKLDMHLNRRLKPESYLPIISNSKVKQHTINAKMQLSFKKKYFEG
jgi:hypothetical protein